MGHGAQQFLLLLDANVFKNVRGKRVRQDAKDDDLLVFRKIEDHLGQVGRRPVAKHLAQSGEIARVDQALNFRDENFADHKLGDAMRVLAPPIPMRNRCET